MSKRCPHCKNTQFSVSSQCFQQWDGLAEEWGGIDDYGETLDGAKPYCCKSCGQEYEYKELEDYNAEEEATQRKLK